MANLTVVDDAALECAVLVDTDTWTALPIVAMGENRSTLLRAFVDNTPFDLTLLKEEAMLEGWRQFLTAHGVIPEVGTDAPATDQVGAQSSNGNDAEAELADATATNTTDTPGAQPADTDAEGPPPTRTVTADCFNCNGTGRIEFGDGAEPVRCNVCKGSGTIEQTVPA